MGSILAPWLSGLLGNGQGNLDIVMNTGALETIRLVHMSEETEGAGTSYTVTLCCFIVNQLNINSVMFGLLYGSLSCKYSIEMEQNKNLPCSLCLCQEYC